MQLVPLFFAFSLMSKFRQWSIKLGGDFYLLAFVGAFVVVTLVLFLWALSFRDPTSPRHGRRHGRRHHKSASPAIGDSAKGGGFFSRRRHKHRRKKHRPVNPTRAETGGLPAARDSQAPPKSLL